jgi:hypothetical protein
MSDELAQREMTLDEWVARLPLSHHANTELVTLRARLAALERELAALRERHAEKEKP